MIRFLKKNFINWQFFKYVVVGLVGTAFDFSILYVLVEFGHLHYLFGALASVTIVLWISFTLNKYWTFADYEEKYFRQFVKYAISHMIALGASLLVLVILVEIFNFWYLFAKVFATMAAAITNFLLVKSFIFSTNQKKKIS